MIILIPFILFVIFLILSISIHEKYSEIIGVFTIVMTIITGFFSIIAFCVFLDLRTRHIDQLVEYRTNTISVQILTKQVGRLREIYNQEAVVTKNSEALLIANNDTPIASVVKHLADATTELTKMELRKNELRTQILSRKMGLYGFLVDWYGEE